MVRGLAHVLVSPGAGTLAPLVLAALTAGTSSTARSQAGRPAPEPPPSVMVVAALRGADSATRLDAAAAVTERLTAAAGSRELRVIPQRDVRENLRLAGYRLDEPISVDEARQLARVLRADAIVYGEARRDRTGFRIDLSLALLHDRESEEQVETGTGSSIDKAAGRAAAALRASLQQLPAERRCHALVQGGKGAEAVQVARAAGDARPSATLVRGCLLRAFALAGAPPDSVLRVANEMLARDPLDRLALQYATDASVRSGERERATEFGSRYQRQDENCRAPAGATGTESLPNAIAIFDSLVRVRPASLGCREAQLRVLKAAHQWRRVIAAADTLAQLDSSYATEAFQLRLARDISRDSQPALAAEMLGRVTAARPQSVDLWLLYAQMLDEAGEYRQAIGVARYALGLDSARATAWLRIATEHSKLNEPDSVLALARVAAPRVDSVGRFQLAQSLLSQAGPLYKVAERTKARADFERVLPLVLVADTLAGAVPLRAQAKLLIGALRLMIGQSLAQEAARSRSCEMARDAQASLNAAQVAAPAGGAASPAAAAQIMQGALQASDYAARLAAAVCRKGRDE